MGSFKQFSGVKAGAIPSKAWALRARSVPYDDWSWSPRHGRWTPGFGLPATASYLSMSTRDFAGANPYDAWRHHAYYAFDAHPLPPADARAFDASVKGLLSTGGEFFSYSSHAMSGFGWPEAAERDGGDAISLGLVVEGERRARGDNDEVTIARPGDFFLFDPRSRTDFSWTRHRAMHLMLRRPAVERALGCTTPSAATMLQAVTAARIMPLLRDQLIGLASTIEHLDAEERSFLLHQTIRLALFACGQRAEDAAGGLYVAAMRLIDRQLDNPALSPDALACTLRVSRATLYRAFAEHDLAVGEAIRTARLDRARSLIAQGAQVAEAALACGWYDTANFARAFKARHGMLPSEARDTPR
ncbi:MAG: hypothetical protein C0500_04955 [Sphingobium sp.]|nr:hypothetical protein [Sphingobium sp.]